MEGHCSSLQFQGGSVHFTGYNIGDIANYVCAPKTVMYGNKRRQCQSNGMWDGKEPICIGKLNS